MHVNVTETPYIPYEVDRYYVLGSNRARVSVVGDVVGPLFPTMPVNATSLLDLPMVCMFYIYFNFKSRVPFRCDIDCIVFELISYLINYSISTKLSPSQLKLGFWNLNFSQVILQTVQVPSGFFYVT